MRLEKGKIPSSGLVFLMIGYIFGSSLILNPGRAAGRDAWIAILLGLVEGLLIALVFVTLSNRFPGKTLVEISDLVYGRYLGKLVSIAFLWYLFHLGSLVLSNFTPAFSSLFLRHTPEAVIALMLTLVCVMAVRHGIEVLTRCSEVLTPLIVVILLLDTVMIIGQFKLKNLQPVLETPLPTVLWAAQASAAFPFAETVSFLMILPFLNKREEALPSVVKSLLFAGAILALVSVRNVGVLGATERTFTYPSFLIVAYINIADLTRMEVLIVTTSIVTGFMKIAALLYGTALGAGQVLGLLLYQPLVLPLGILMIILSLYNFSNMPQNMDLIQKSYPIYALPFQVGIPLLTLALAAIRRLPDKERQS